MAGEEFKEKVIMVRRVAKVTEGGKRFRFNALVAVGDMNGRVGIGYGRAGELIDAVRKASEKAKKSIIWVKFKGKTRTIPHEIKSKFKSSQIILKPASPGTGVIAGGAVRLILELAGIEDILTKAIGSTNPVNLAKATIKALSSLMDPRYVSKKRGRSLREIWGMKEVERQKGYEGENIESGSAKVNAVSDEVSGNGGELSDEMMEEREV